MFKINPDKFIEGKERSKTNMKWKNWYTQYKRYRHIVGKGD